MPSIGIPRVLEGLWACTALLMVASSQWVAASTDPDRPGSTGTAAAPSTVHSDTAPMADGQARQVLAPTGKLRVGLYLGGPTNFIRGATPGEHRGVGYDLGGKLSALLDVPFEPVVHPNAADVVEGLKSGRLDVAFLARTPERERDFLLSRPILMIEHGFLVPPDSVVTSLAEVDRPGIRIGTPQGGSVNVVISGYIRQATIIPVPGLAAAGKMLASGQLDIFAANKANLFELADTLPGARVLDGRFGVDEITIAIPRDREATSPYLEKFVGYAKSVGMIDTAIRRSGLRGALGE